MRAPSADDPRRALPALGRLLTDPRVGELTALYGRPATLDALRAEVDDQRRARRETNGELEDPATEVLERARARLGLTLGGATQRVLNATGVLLHTNLGRAPLPREVTRAVADIASGSCDLELDLDSNRRGERLRRVTNRLGALAHAEAALVTNNAAAALVLAVATLAYGREVIVSRGELVEIGGSFRLPEILAAAGARLVEVGTTNRTRVEDYAAAIGPDTALLLRVHPSNFTLAGFVATPELSALAELARRSQVPLVVDEGSGLLQPSDRLGVRGTVSISEILLAGASIVIASGDKLLGGPQAGLMLGDGALISRCHQHPLYRALRPGKLVLVTLEQILGRRLAGDPGPLASLDPPPAQHWQRVVSLARRVQAAIVSGDATLGGGAGAEVRLPGPVLALAGGERRARALRLGSPAIVGYLRDGQLLLDLRTIESECDEELAIAIAASQGRNQERLDPEASEPDPVARAQR